MSTSQLEESLSTSQLEESLSTSQLEESLSTSQFDRLVLIFEENNTSIKSSEKKRLISKFSWITRSISAPTNRERESVALDPIEEPPSNRVTTLQVDLTDNEKKVLSLGPNFAITPRVDENLVKEVKLNMASYAYQLRWMKYSENTNTCATRAQHLKKEGAPINKIYVHPPPTNNTIVEDKLKQMNNFFIHLYKNSVVPFNLSHDEAVGLKSLRGKKSDLHFSVSDKGGEFVVMNQGIQRDLTENHISNTVGVYKYRGME